MHDIESNPFTGTPIPEMELFVEPQVQSQGKPVLIGWKAEADEVLMWHSPDALVNIEPDNWAGISHLCKPVEQSGRIEMPLETSTALYLVARSANAWSGIQEIIPLAARELEKKPTTWSPLPQYLPQMEDRSFVKWTSMNHRPLWEALLPQLRSLAKTAATWNAGPTVTLTASPQVIFEDESSTLSWSLANSNCASSGLSHHKTGLVIDTSSYSGTRRGGGGFGAGSSLPCGVQNGTGSWEVTSKVTSGPSHARAWLNASSPIGSSIEKTVWIDLLSVPKSQGATPQRLAEIRNAIRDIDSRLRTGCIINDTWLDSKVDAFKKQHINRKQFWFRLLAELQNIGLVTFICNDVSDTDWSAGSWKDFTNDIVLEWSPSHTPYLEYVILHELCHKVGFNGSLLKYYSVPEVENQAHTVSGACYP